MSRIKTHVKKGDQVVVIAGAAKGAQGTIIEVQPSKGRVLVEGVRWASTSISANAWDVWEWRDMTL